VLPGVVRFANNVTQGYFFDIAVHGLVLIGRRMDSGRHLRARGKVSNTAKIVSD
jgi:hypothetical protein